MSFVACRQGLGMMCGGHCPRFPQSWRATCGMSVVGARSLLMPVQPSINIHTASRIVSLPGGDAYRQISPFDIAHMSLRLLSYFLRLAPEGLLRRRARNPGFIRPGIGERSCHWASTRWVLLIPKC